MTTSTPCPSLGERLAAREGEPSPAAARAVQEHVRACPDCRQDLQEVDRLLAVSNDDATVMDAERLARGEARLRAALDAQQTAPPTRWRWRWRPVLATAATVALLVMLSGWIVGRIGIARAEGLIADAAAAERTRDPETSPGTRVRLLPSSEAPLFKSWTGMLGGDHEPPRAVAALLDRYGRATDVISARHFQAWRQSLTHRRDIVIRRGNLRVIRTLTLSSDLLRGAELILHHDTHAVMGVTLIGPNYRVELEPLHGQQASPRDE